MPEGRVFDVIIVGAGPAGCVMARRLSEDAQRTVALIEAGPDYGADPANWPPETRDPSDIFPDFHSWGYFHTARPLEKPLPLPRTRIVGGSSTINGCIWLRGSASDYDRWVELGNSGWSFADLLPYFRRAEADPLGGPLHGTDGPIPIHRVDPSDFDPVERAVVAASEALGFAWQADLNGAPAQQPGIGPTPRNIAEGGRMHAAHTYLAAVRQRPNLSIIPDTLIDTVCFASGHATGVRTVDGREIQGRQVVLCAGAYGSPAILLRSGIGPAGDLEELGIPVIAHRPGVGTHLLDHPTLVYANEDYFGTYRVKPEFAPPAVSTIPTLIKARSSQAADEVDFYVIHGQQPGDVEGEWLAWFLINLETAPSCGSVRLTDSDPNAPLDIDHAYLSEISEVEACCDGIELIDRLVNTRPLADTIDPLPERVPRWSSRDDLRAWVRAQASTTYHPSSTCRMGRADDPLAVVDASGRVYGVAGLYVADASIFPTSPRANLHCTVVAVAEKLADAFRGKANA
ncbi:MAG: GMC family oxidoreductase N-terminal domain-containing protein [Thermomicrobiales bacterium]